MRRKCLIKKDSRQVKDEKEMFNKGGEYMQVKNEKEMSNKEGDV